MNSRLPVLASILCIAFLQPAAGQQAIDYFPMHPGDYWIHRTDTLGSVYDPATYRAEVLAIDEVGGEQLYRYKESVTADDGDPQMLWYSWMRVDPEGIVIAAVGDTSLVDSADFSEPPALWLSNAMTELGHTWEVSTDVMPGHYSFVVESTAVTVVVPAGTFDNCIKIKLIHTMDEETTQQSWHYYAPGVGQVLNTGSNLWFGGSFRFELTEYYVQTVSVGREKGEIPRRFRLHQNYPNPFNPNTTVKFDLPEATAVQIIIYDILGREVARLADQPMKPGYHQLIWNGRDCHGRELPSGLYIARLLVPPKAGVTMGYSKSIKMLLLK